jgi:hypothetical protein
MPKFKRIALTFSLIAGMQVASTYSAAIAHGVVTPLPVNHAAATASALKTLLLHRKNALLPLAGTGSATVRFNNQTLKSIITNGYSGGQTAAINSQLGGLVKSGNLNGVLYYNYGSPSGYLSLGDFSFAIGGAPRVGLGEVSGTFNTSNTLTFAASSILKQRVGSALPYSAGLSGAEKARTALYKSLSTASTAAGEKSITSLGQLSGGELYGTFGHYGGAGVYLPYATSSIAFGNNPYNSISNTYLPTTQLKNYLTYANGVTRTVTGGQLTFITTTEGSPTSIYDYGTYGLAFGNSPYNGVFSSYQISLLKNIINLAALK